MDKKPLIVISLFTVILLVLCSSVSAFANNYFSFSKTKSSISFSSGEDYTVYIGAGVHRMYGEGKFGWGWHMFVENTGDTNVTGSMYSEETTLSGELISYGTGNFSLLPGCGSGSGSVTLADLHPINLIDLTVVVENTTYSKSGYGIGPFVLLVD